MAGSLCYVESPNVSTSNSFLQKGAILCNIIGDVYQFITLGTRKVVVFPFLLNRRKLDCMWVKTLDRRRNYFLNQGPEGIGQWTIN